MPKGIPTVGKRKLDPAKNNGGKRDGAGRKPRLPPGTTIRSYRATPTEHAALKAYLAQLRQIEGEKP